MLSIFNLGLSARVSDFYHKVSLQRHCEIKVKDYNLNQQTSYEKFLLFTGEWLSLSNGLKGHCCTLYGTHGVEIQIFSKSNANIWQCSLLLLILFSYVYYVIMDTCFAGNKVSNNKIFKFPKAFIYWLLIFWINCITIHLLKRTK